jgi:glycosyltransferase involved in cell wall biosynthesis
MRVEMVVKGLRAEGHECVPLNTGMNRRVASPEYETVMDPLDFVKKVWRYSWRGYTIHSHVNGDSLKGFVRTLLSQTIGLLAGKRGYLTFHAGVDQPFFPRHKARWLIPVYWVMFTIPRRIICNSEPVRHLVAGYGVSPHKIVSSPAFTRQYLHFERVTLSPAIEGFFAGVPHVLFTYIRIREGFNLATLMEGFALLAHARPDVGLLFVGLTDDVDPRLWADVQARITKYDLASRMCIVDDLDHDQFLTALTRSVMYLRTPTTDGVSSSVLEAMALGVPVVAAENGTRPRGVVTFDPDRPDQLAAQVAHVLSDRAHVVAQMAAPEIRDTLRDEIDVLTGA